MKKLYGTIVLVLILLGAARSAPAQATQGEDSEFGPVVRAYLGYLRNEQDVVDDRNSRHEISAVYYRRNSNRIRALRQMAIRIARQSGNDFLPELEAVAANELGNLFEKPPRPAVLRVGKVYNNTFRFLGAVRAGETFYIFARLDQYEQAELIERGKAQSSAGPKPSATLENVGAGPAHTRSRRTSAP